jgi:hypothetical protein
LIWRRESHLRTVILIDHCTGLSYSFSLELEPGQQVAYISNCTLIKQLE